MRSRFTAYALGHVDYILHTTAPDGPQYDADTSAWRAQVASFSQAYQFTGLEIVDAPEPMESTGQVHFRAELKRDGQPHVLEERSLFRRADDRWLYVGPVSEETG